VPDPLGGDVDDLALGPAQGRHPPAEDGAGVEADRVVDPRGARHGCVAVHDGGAAAVVLGPRVAHGQAELVGLAGGVAVQGVAADPAGGAAVRLPRQPGVPDAQPAAVEDVLTDQAVDELPYLGTELLALP